MSSSSRLLHRRIRILKSELKMLQNYYDESYELFKDYDREWTGDIAYFREKFSDNIAAPIEEDDNQKSYPLSDFVHSFTGKSVDESLELKFHPEWAKKLFRKIAMATHPDRVTKESKERLLQLFRRASNALDNEDHEELLSLALDLAIPIDIDGPALRPLLEKRIIDIKKKIEDLEKKPPWVWGESFGLHQIKAPLLRLILAEYGIEKNDDELISEIQEREVINDTR